jgi:hypothetical protein
MKNKIILYPCLALLLLGLQWPIFAQTTKPVALEREADFNMVALGGNAFRFESLAGTLTKMPIAGATNEPSFGHYWEFGDGHFSFDENPAHTYRYAPLYDAVLYLTNNYDNGELPKTKPKRPKFAEGFASNTPVLNEAYLPDGDHLQLQSNHDPKPNEQMVGIITYKNMAGTASSGKLYLFFNETAYEHRHFDLMEQRTPFGESRDSSQTLEGLAYDAAPMDYWAGLGTSLSPNIHIRSTDFTSSVNDALQTARSNYRDVAVWNTGNMLANEERNLFLGFQTTSQMLDDTSATVTIYSLFVPDVGDAYAEDLLSMTVVAAHDPNNIGVSKTRTSFRRINKKSLTYTVQFENTGKGTADSITIDCTIPKALDITSSDLRATHLGKSCPPCAQIQYLGESCISQHIMGDTLRFVFHNIALPGKADGKTREDRKGFVKYAINPNKKIEKRTFKSRASIYFDKEPAVVTNNGTTRFKHGISVGAKVAYNRFAPSDEGPSSYFAGGITLSPFKSYRLYFQPEIMLGYKDEGEMRFLVGSSQDGQVKIDTFAYRSSSSYRLDVVPLQVRKNINGFLGVGLGAQLSLYWDKLGETEHFEEYINNVPSQSPLNGLFLAGASTPIKATPSLFANVSLGSVRLGPSLGLRYHYKLNTSENDHWQLYALWKF